MPIKPENRHHYGKAWKAIRAKILERAGHCCEECGRPNRRNVAVFKCGCWDISYAPGYAGGRGIWSHRRYGCESRHEDTPRIVRTVLTIAHLNQTPGDDREENLAALCNLHHLRLDHVQHMTNSRATRNRKRGIQELPLEGLK